jgi:hypothetical protein
VRRAILLSGGKEAVVFRLVTPDECGPTNESSAVILVTAAVGLECLERGLLGLTYCGQKITIDSVTELGHLFITEDDRTVPGSSVAGFNDYLFRNRDAEIVSTVSVSGVCFCSSQSDDSGWDCCLLDMDAGSVVDVDGCHEE